jgi:glutamine amidotransferase
MTQVAIIDNGGANIASLRHALERLGAQSELVTDADALRTARRVLLPGVGAAADAMTRLHALGLVEAIRGLTQPVLGICLGMQLLYSGSDEGDIECLGLVDGRVARIPDSPDRPVPHMGWNQLERGGDEPLLTGLRDREYFYYVHSYAAPVGPSTVATTRYGEPFTAVVRRGNFAGVQFHPERSGLAGARLLANFLAGD